MPMPARFNTYCEAKLTLLGPHNDVWDARWDLVETRGTHIRLVGLGYALDLVLVATWARFRSSDSAQHFHVQRPVLHPFPA